MINKPKFKDHFHVEIVPPHNVFLLTENKYWVLTDPIHQHLVPFLQGEHTLSEILSQLDGRILAPQVYYVLQQLESRGYITEASQAIPREIGAFWESLGISSAVAMQRLQETPVYVSAIGKTNPTPLIEALKQNHVQVQEQADEAEMLVFVVDDYLESELESINQKALDSGQSWMLVRLTGYQSWLGPIFTPGQTACWACLANRLRINRQLESYILRKSNRQAPLEVARTALPTTLQSAAQMASLEITKWVGQGKKSELQGQMRTINHVIGEMQNHVVVRRPQCPVCGEPEKYNQFQPPQLQSRAKTTIGEEKNRAVLPEETFERYKHHLSPLVGIVTWLVDITGEINGFWYAYSAGHSFALAIDNLDWLIRILRSNTGGKGVTPIQAKVSAMCEAIERYSGVYRGDEPVVRGSYRSLAPEAVHLYECLHFSPQQYANRDAWNAQLKGGRFHVVPNPFDEELEIDWSPFWSLTKNSKRYIPTAFAYYGHPEATQHFFCAGSSNGIAAGNTLEEAILRGFLELVERDSVALWWYNRVQRPLVDTDSFNLPYIQALKAYYQTLHREFWVLDITSDLGIPAFAAVSRRIDRQPEDITVGFAAHLSPESALMGAIVELNQFLPAVMRDSPQGGTWYNFPHPEGVEWWKTATLENQPYLVPDKSVPTKKASDYPRLNSSDLLTDVQTCVAIAEKAGMEVLVQDQTRPDIGLNVCRVIVPGLRHFWRHLGPGRLYDVPVQLGWLERPLSEEALNPIPIFF